MPEIPRSIAPESVSIPEASPAQFARGWAALSYGGQQLEDLGQKGMHVASVIERARANVALMKAENMIEADIDKEIESYALRTDYQNFAGSMQEFSKKLNEKYQTEFGNDPIVGPTVQLHLDKQLEHARHTVTMKGVGLLVDEGRYNLDLKEHRMAEQWALALPSERERIENDMEITWQSAQSGHIISETDMGKRRERWMETREETEIIGLTKSSNPAEVQMGMDRLQQKNYYKNIDSKKQAMFLAAAESHLAVLNNRLEKDVRDANVAVAVAKLKTRWGADYNRIFQDLRSAETWKEFNLDPKAVEQVRQFFNGEHSEFNQARNDTSERLYKQGVLLIDDNKLSAVHMLIRNPDLLASHADVLRRAAEVKAKHPDEDISPQEDSRTYLKIKNLIDAGELEKAEQAAITEPLAKTATRHKLLDSVSMHRDATIHAGLTAGGKFLHSQIAPSRGLGIPSIPEEEANSSRAQQDLEVWVRKQQALVAEGKRKSLTQKEITDYSEQIMPNYRLTMDQKLEAVRRMMEREKKEKETPPSGRGTSLIEEPSAPPVSKRLVGTKNGVPVYDLGNGQWQIGD